MQLVRRQLLVCRKWVSGVPARQCAATSVIVDARVGCTRFRFESCRPSAIRWFEGGAPDASRIAPVSAMRVFDAAEQANGDLNFDAYGAHTNELAWIVEDQNLGNALDTAFTLCDAYHAGDWTGNGTEI